MLLLLLLLSHHYFSIITITFYLGVYMYICAYTYVYVCMYTCTCTCIRAWMNTSFFLFFKFSFSSFNCEYVVYQQTFNCMYLLFYFLWALVGVYNSLKETIKSMIQKQCACKGKDVCIHCMFVNGVSPEFSLWHFDGGATQLQVPTSAYFRSKIHSPEPAGTHMSLYVTLTFTGSSSQWVWAEVSLAQESCRTRPQRTVCACSYTLPHW